MLGAYWSATREPLYCLVFLLPLVATYEFGALMLRVSVTAQHDLVALELMRTLLSWLGAGGLLLPGLTVVLTLLLWHVFSRRPWKIHAWVPLLMAVESVVLVPPLLALTSLRLQAGGAPRGALAEQMVLALGAGIFEELVFRLALLSLLLLLLVDVFRVPRGVAGGVAIGLGAAIFALCHYQPVGGEVFGLGSFLVRLAAGAYLSLLYLARGLGIATGCHAAYNLLLLLL